MWCRPATETVWVDLLIQSYVVRNVVVAGMTPGDVHESADRCGGHKFMGLLVYYIIGESVGR